MPLRSSPGDTAVRTSESAADFEVELRFRSALNHGGGERTRSEWILLISDRLISGINTGYE